MICILLYATSLVQLIHGVEPRTWTDQTGSHRTEAEFVAFQNGTVWLKRTNGLLISLPIDRLSADDQLFVRQRTSSVPAEQKESPSETEPKGQVANPTPEKATPEKQGDQGDPASKELPAEPKSEAKPSPPAPQERAPAPAQPRSVLPKQDVQQTSLVADAISFVWRQGRWVFWAGIVFAVTLLVFTAYACRCEIRVFFRGDSRVARSLAVIAGMLLTGGIILLCFLWGGFRDGGLSEGPNERMPAAVGGTLLLATMIGACLSRMRRRHHAELVRKTCPRCLAIDTLQPDNSGEFGAVTQLFTCSNAINEESYQECGSRVPSLYQELVKLYFSCLGHPSAGKTMWMAMAYRELTEGRYPDALQFMQPKFLGSDVWDGLADQIVNERICPGATPSADIPDPLVFSFLDGDWARRSNVLVELFDFAGEVTLSCRLDVFQRRRALKTHGFLLFLDHTQDFRCQSNEVSGVVEDLRVIDQRKLGQDIRVPVAVCVPKIDLLPNVDSDHGGVWIKEFYEQLGTIGWKKDLASIRARSELAVRSLRMVWPNCDVERLVLRAFGRRCMFFPLTSVGMDDLGQTDIRDRIIAPIGILDPLLWLLHMNGYQCLG